MWLKQKGYIILLNALVGGGYVAAILLLIHWVSTVHVGIGAFFVPLGLLVLIILGWMAADRRKYPSHRTMPRNVQTNS
ncbi:hypothetical protein [Ammoniphilus sp. 3BR4]|uniref:hypothetical protein n=1 Tax=Ammoniphilus sp. 3BR4 TaxID=3158265 RepID=UPI0034670F7F